MRLLQVALFEDLFKAALAVLHRDVLHDALLGILSIKVINHLDDVSAALEHLHDSILALGDVTDLE